MKKPKSTPWILSHMRSEPMNIAMDLTRTPRLRPQAKTVTLADAVAAQNKRPPSKT